MSRPTLIQMRFISEKLLQCERLQLKNYSNKAWNPWNPYCTKNKFISNCHTNKHLVENYETAKTNLFYCQALICHIRIPSGCFSFFSTSQLSIHCIALKSNAFFIMCSYSQSKQCWPKWQQLLVHEKRLKMSMNQIQCQHLFNVCSSLYETWK